MILTDYYKLVELKPSKSHRLDCVAMNGSHPTFEAIADKSRTKAAYAYVNGVPEQFNAVAQRRADMALTCTKSISSIYTPDLNNALMGYGDVKGTEDAMLFLFSEDYKRLEIFIARGHKRNRVNLFNLFADGELDAECAALREAAKAVGKQTSTSTLEFD